MALTVSPGASYTWSTASWPWDDVRADKTWAEAYSAAYLEADTESLTAAEARSSDATLPRSEAVALAEARASLADVNDVEAVPIAEAGKDIVGYFRSLAEAFSASELGSREVARNTAEAATVAETRRSSMTTQRDEGLALTEAAARLVVAYELEAISLADASAEVVAFARNAAEALSLSEARVASAAKALTEALTASEATTRTASYTRLQNEALGAAEAATARILKTFGELIAPAEATANIVGFNRDAAEPIGIAEDYVDLIGFINAVSESILVSEEAFRAASKRAAEALGVSEAAGREITKRLAEALAAAETYIDLIGFLNATAESISVAEARRATVVHRSAEAIAAIDRLVRRANAVVADLAIRSAGMTQAEFAERIAFRKPLGNFPPKPLQPGDYRYERAIIGILLQDAARTTREVALDTAKLTVDVPDVTDRGSVTLTTSGATIPFTRSFYDPPEIQVIQTGGSTRALPSVSTIMASGFFVQLFDAASPTTPVAGTISWTALGK